MFFPFTTDAPLYYRPFGTLALIVLNVLVMFVVGVVPDGFESLALPYGEGLTPLQWISSTFLHFGWEHLFGNMIFLWSFGLIVEGKLGWQRFLPLYLAIAVVECLIEQLIFWNSSGMSCGASAAIFGLMAICLIWAPRNELSIFYIILLRSGVVEVSIVLFSLLNLAMSGLMLYFLPDSESELLHLLGAVVGGIAGILLLKTGQVDCEGWDLFSVMSGRIPARDDQYSWQHNSDQARRKNRKVAERQQSPAKETASHGQESVLNTANLATAAARFQELVVQGKVHAAHAMLARIRLQHPEFQPEAGDLFTLARGLKKRQEWNACVEMFQELRRVAPRLGAAALELAEILTLVQNRPSAARRILQEIPEETLTPRQRERLQKLNEQIEILIESGVLEIQDP